MRMLNIHGVAFAIMVAALVIVGTPLERALATETNSRHLFPTLKGYWSGSGTMNGEKVRCRVTYIGGGTTVKQSLRCSTSAGLVLLILNLKKQGSKVSGSFLIPKFEISGAARGQANKNGLNLNFKGGTIAGTMNIEMHNCRSHSIFIRVKGEFLGKGALRLSRKKKAKAC